MTSYYFIDILNSSKGGSQVNRIVTDFLFLDVSCENATKHDKKFVKICRKNYKGGGKMINTNKIKARIMELGLTQEDIADKVGINRSTFNLKITNKRRIYMDEVVKVCQALNISTPVDLKEMFELDFLVATSCEKETL